MLQLKFKLILLLLISTSLISLHGCDDISLSGESSNPVDEDTPLSVNFTENQKTIFVRESGQVDTIDVSIIRPANSTTSFDISVVDTVEIDGEKIANTAESGVHYELNTNSVTIEEGEAIGALPITTFTDNLSDPVTLALDLADDRAAQFKNSAAVTIREFCPLNTQELAGVYNMIFPVLGITADSPIPVQLVPADNNPNQIIMLNPLTGSEVEINLDDSDPADFRASMTDQWLWNQGQEQGRGTGSGPFSMCEQTLEFSLTLFTETANFGGGFPFTLIKTNQKAVQSSVEAPAEVEKSYELSY